MSTARDFHLLLISGYVRRIVQQNTVSQILKTCIMFYNGHVFHVEIPETAFSMNADDTEAKAHPQSWANCDGASFMVRRGPNYVDGKKKLSKASLYTIFKVHAYQTPFKMREIWKYVIANFDDEFTTEIERANTINAANTIPPLILINFMIPNYSPEIGKNKKNDGTGYSTLLCCHLSDDTLKKLDKFINSKSQKKLPLSASIKLLSRFIEDKALQKERFKIIFRALNSKYSNFGFVAKGLISKYNSKPFLARTSTTFYYEAGKYFGVDIDVHSFSFAAKKGLNIFKDSLDSLIYEMGIVIQGKDNDELPEQMLTGIRMTKLPSDVFYKDLSKDMTQKYLNDHK